MVPCVDTVMKSNAEIQQLKCDASQYCSEHRMNITDFDKPFADTSSQQVAFFFALVSLGWTPGLPAESWAPDQANSVHSWTEE